MKRGAFIRKQLFFLSMLGCMCLAGCSGKEGGNPAGDSGGWFRESKKHGMYFLLLFFMLFLTACGKTEGTPELGIDGYIYQARQLPAEEEYQIEGLKVDNDSLWFMANGGIYSLPLEENMDFGNRKLLTSNSNVTDYVLGQDGAVYYVLMNYSTTKDWQSVPAGCTLVKQKGSWSQEWQKPFPDINISWYGKCLEMDGNGQLILLSEDALYWIDEKGEIKDTVSVENYQFTEGAQRLATGDAGRIYYCTARSWYGSNDETWGIYEVTGAEDSPLKEIPGKKGIPYSSAYGLLCDSSDGMVYQYRGETAAWEPVFRWSDSNLSSPNTNSNELVQTDEEHFTVMLRDVISENFNSVFYQLSRTAVSELPEKEILVLAATEYISDELKEWVSRFNRENDRYHITLEQYGIDEIDTKLNSRLVSSNPPDLVDVNWLDVVSYGEKQTFEDLAPFLEASDALDRDMFFDRLLESNTIDGRLVCIPRSFYIATVFGRASEVGTDTGWTGEEVMALAEKYPDRRLLQIGDEFLVRRLFGIYLCEHYIDWESGECTFDSEEFHGFLEWLKGYLNRIHRQFDDTWEYLAEDCLLYMDGITDLSSRARYERELGEELTFIGHPTSEGRPCIPVEVQNALCITSRSRHKEGAWQFLEYFLSREEAPAYYFSSRKDIFQRELDEEMTPDYFYNEDGSIRMMDGSIDMEGNALSGPFMKARVWDSNGEVLYYYMSQEQADALLEIIEVLDFTPRGGAQDRVLDIIDEESAGYLDGSRSVKETAEIIQNRVRNLVQESL